MYALLYMYDTENGEGAEVIAISEDKLYLQALMQKEAEELKSAIEAEEGCNHEDDDIDDEDDDTLWDSDLTEYEDSYINLGYQSCGVPDTWRWEIQEVDSPEVAPAKVVVIVKGGMVQEAYSDRPELIDFDVIDLDNAVAEDDEETADALFDAADEARKNLQPVY